MALVFAGVCSHAPGITGRAHLADPALKDALHGALYALGDDLRATRPDALVLIAAEHFANFFMDNMPAYAIGMADRYEGPIEDPGWLGIEKRRIPGNSLDLVNFRRRFAMAVAGIADTSDERRADILRLGRSVPDDVLGPFLLLAKAAQDGEPCPADYQLARAYGTSSPGRIRRLIEHLEKSGLIVVRTDFGGRRSIGIPELGLSTAPMEA